MKARRLWLRLTVAILLLVAVAVGVGCWAWVTWPQRRLAQLCEAMAQGHFDRASELVARSRWVTLSNGLVRFDINDESERDVAKDEEWRLIFRETSEHFTLQPCSTSDVLAARGKLALKGRHQQPLHSRAGEPVPMATPLYEFTSERGRISVTLTWLTKER